MSAYKRTLEIHEHLIPVNRLSGTEPTTIHGTYFGEYQGTRYSYQSGMDSWMRAKCSIAKSEALTNAEAKYIEMFRLVRGEQIPFYKDYEEYLPQYLFWTQENDAMRDSFVRKGLLPSEEEFVLSQLGIDALVL